MAFAWVAGNPSPSQAAPQGDAAATSAKPLALGKFTKHRKKHVRHRARTSRKHHHQASAKTSSSKADKHDEAKADKTKADETTADKALPPSVANARAELTSNTPEQPLAAQDAPIDSSTLTEADKTATTGIAPSGVQITTSDQLNDMDRDAATPAASPAPATVALAQISQPAIASAGEESAWSSASLIGKFFIAFGVMLTLASAARMIIA
jgi:hypothetical protein